MSNTVYDMTHANDVIRECENVTPTLESRMGTGGNQVPLTMEDATYVVRRLTPKECTKLQGFPEDWLEVPPVDGMSQDEFDFWNNARAEKAKMEGKTYKPPKDAESMVKWYNKTIAADSNKYKAIGNSICLPQWFWLAQRMKPTLGGNAKIGSLFDGIAGFPLVWEQVFGAGTARWSSEIACYPQIVSKYHFPEN